MTFGEIKFRPLTKAENSGIRGAIRRWFARQPIVREVLEKHKRKVPRYKKDGSRHKVDRVEHLCNVCHEWRARKLCEVDHIIPVIDIEDGFVDWNTYIARLVQVKIEDLQIICEPCHDIKTATERAARQLRKDNEELKALDDRIHTTYTVGELAELRQTLKRFMTKKKPDSIKEWAKRLRDYIDKETND